MEDDYSCVRGAGIEDARVVAMVVAQMIDDGVEPVESLKQGRVAPVVAHGEAREQFFVGGAEALDEERDLRTLRQVRQKLFAVIRDAGRLRAKRAEVCETHKKVGRRQTAGAGGSKSFSQSRMHNGFNYL